ncbi:MAG TPA: hypothetical protein VII56_01010 [Rhizomicrobium sp.]
MASPLADLARSGVLAGSNLELRFFPVYDVQRQSVAALFCTPMDVGAGVEAIYGHKAFHDFSVSDWAGIDCAILGHALGFAGRLTQNGIVAAVGASVSFTTLCDPNGRVAYREALRIAHAREQNNLVIKIEDVPPGTGGQRIAEIVSCVRALAPRVWVHLPGSEMPLAGHEQLRATGLVLSMPPRLPAHGMATEARWLARAAALQTALACMDHVDSASELDIVRTAGIRFVAGHALKRPALCAGTSPESIRASLYAAQPADALLDYSSGPNIAQSGLRLQAGE